ncbi:CvpA family protein [Methylomonas fluvii]|uniref:CvpA family protein n=1 Tax=Methylomonas fluvii TaxID=1854564 RepID=A0ABR9DJN8_9GAMM|nr:CvpA family protein [Methylomonas fluvii]MBD9363312.1 CvpA family protein [Methylomonas fluvii]CAD6876577.1 Colicin V production protein [Methylomonas fluvii]
MLDFVPWAKLLWVDYVVISIILISAIMGLMRGFIKEAFALVLWMVAVWVATQYCRDVSVLLQSTISYPSARIAAAFALLFFATLILGSLISFLLSQLIEKTGLTGSDRLLGMLFGIARGAVLVSLLVMLAGLTPLPEDPWWKQSLLIPPFQALAVWLKTHMPTGLADYIHYR